MALPFEVKLRVRGQELFHHFGVFLRLQAARAVHRRAAGLGEHVLLRINVSPVQLVSADFAATVGPILDEFGIPGSSMCFEFRESVVVQDFEAASSTLAS